jgi:hypothetical protein
MANLEKARGKYHARGARYWPEGGERNGLTMRNRATFVAAWADRWQSCRTNGEPFHGETEVKETD